jgi:hypothetical protein
MKDMKLFMALLGGKPTDSLIEAHNVFFGVGPDIEFLFPAMKKAWPSAPKIHMDAYMCVERIGKWSVGLVPMSEKKPKSDLDHKLFFLNLGWYQNGVLQEFHKNLLIVAKDEAEASKLAKNDPIFKGGYSEGKATSHIDDKKMIDEFEDEKPLDVANLVEPQGFALKFELIPNYFPGMPLTYPQAVVTGFFRLPAEDSYEGTKGMVTAWLS